MLNMLGKKRQGIGFKNMEEYTPASLPKNVEEGHTDLSTFITTDYSMLDESFIKKRYDDCESRLSSLVQISDQCTVGEIEDPQIDIEWNFAKNKHEEEVAMHELSGSNILKARAVRAEELKKRIHKLHEAMTERQSRIKDLSGVHAKHTIRAGSVIIQQGFPVTALAFAADYFINTEFVQSILYSNVTMLRILVLCLCLMSDGTMYALGTMISNKSASTSKGIYYTFFSVFVFLFSVSVLGSIAIRVGSMSLTYGSYNAQGVFVSKESFTVAEYALAAVSSLATAVTGALSLYFSIDPEYSFEKECIKLKAEQEYDEKLCLRLEAELFSLEQAVDPMICDRARRKAAEANLEALRKGLKMHIRKLLVLHQQDASYLDAMSESAQKLLESTRNGSDAAAETIGTEKAEDIHMEGAETTDTEKVLSAEGVQVSGKTMFFREGREFKEVG